MEDFPAALVIASRESVCQNNNVLYRLVRPLADGSGVESVDRLVNVVPHRRTYCMDRKKEIDDFRHEILRRPLVLQPILHFGRGIGHYCGACYTDEPWLVMINQTHPKILSRLQMGLDLAKGAIERGQSVEIRFQFGDIVQRVYREHLKQKELNEALESLSGIDDCLVNFRFAEWEHCDLVVRSHGYGARLNRTSPLYALRNLEFTWKFEDIGMHEMVWSQYDGQRYPKPHLSPVTEDEIRTILPAWTINSVSPLAEMGEDVPEHNYSYAQAGRLYESFRKKKRQRNTPLAEPHHRATPQTINHEEELQGAVGYDSNYGYSEVEYNDVNDHEVDRDPSLYAYQNARVLNGEKDRGYEKSSSYEHYGRQHQPYSHYDSGVEDEIAGDWEKSGENKRQETHNTQSDEPLRSPAYADKHGHFNAAVEIKKPPPRSKHHNGNYYDVAKSLYDRPGTAVDYHGYSGPLKKQDSDRSSRSTNADSGYSPETEGVRSREDSYDYNDHSYKSNVKQDYNVKDSVPLKRMAEPPVGLDNPAFNNNNQDALQRHKDMVSQILHEKNSQKSSGYNSGYPSDYNSIAHKSPVILSAKDLSNRNERTAPPKPSRSSQGTVRTAQVAESFI
ncbi:unnamed protein product [Lymnaea stagnalis]|uniref:Uncharacterized protein n=1 Tax=Lymnaea stagnalis TaxID=6523 RepID=A0AAV2H5S8_LYMST